MKPWKEVIRPRREVREGTFKQSDFAVNLMHVLDGTALENYRDPVKFFAQTFVTQGVEELLGAVTKRISGGGGESVIELQTNFGGGKSHTLLAIYHLANSGADARTLPGVAAILDKAGVRDIPETRIAVIDGNNRSPADPMRKDGRTIRTLWGELAYRLLGAKGFDLVAESDAHGVAPGKQALKELLAKASPCVILLDELVAYYRQLDRPDLPGGTYDANLSFLQQLAEEAARPELRAALLVTLPKSDDEAGGSWGQKALVDISKIVHRDAGIWHPVERGEAYEIVRRRLFEPLADEKEMREVCEAFKSFYHENRASLPQVAQAPAFLDAFPVCYPIHPEVFIRLYEDWGELERFQKTRGVLYFMALAIHALWNDPECAEPMIMPGSLPLGDSKVAGQAANWLPGNWGAIIGAEVDGSDSAPVRLEERDPLLGRMRAARRTARTIFLGSAPSVAAQKVRGLDEAQVLLGCASPGEELSFYSNALEKMVDDFRFLFHDGSRYWFDTRPNLNRTVHEKAERVSARAIEEAIRSAFETKWGSPSAPGINRAHVFDPAAKIPDDIMSGLRVVVLPMDAPYSPHAEKPAFDAARAILDYRGASARTYRNRLVFLAADLEKLSRATQLCRMVIAWKEAADDIDARRIEAMVGDGENAHRQARVLGESLEQLVAETFCHLLVPEIGPKGPSGPCAFERFEVRTAPVERLCETVSRALAANEIVVANWAARFLGDHLAATYFGRADDVSVRKVWDDMARFLDYRRLADVDVLRSAIENGVRDGLFGYAAGKKPDGTYEGFKFKEPVMANIGDRELLIKSAKAEKVQPPPPPPPPGGGRGPTPPPPPPPPPPPKPVGKRHFEGSVSLDISGDLSSLDEIRDDVLALIAGRGLTASVRLDIRAESGETFPPDFLRALKTNSRLLDESALS